MTGRADSRLERAIEAIKAGNRSMGRQLLTEIIRENPRNETAWVWMASVSDTVHEMRQCYSIALSINPRNRAAKAGLKRLAARKPRKFGEDPVLFAVTASALLVLGLCQVCLLFALLMWNALL